MEQFCKQGEFTHDSCNPFLNFVSSVLEITILKPIREACTGEDLITGEDLTDLERGLRVVFAVVDLATLGEAFDWPVPVIIMLSRAAGITVIFQEIKCCLRMRMGLC